MDCVVTKAERNGDEQRYRSMVTQEAAILQIAGATKALYHTAHLSL